MEKEVLIYFEDPHVYDGVCAHIYTDYTFEFLDRFKNVLSESKKQELTSVINKIIMEAKNDRK